MLGLVALAVGLVTGGCKKDPAPPGKAGCTKSSDCAAGQVCTDGACVAEVEAPAVPDTPCDRALASIDGLNTAQGKAGMHLDLEDLRKQCDTWPPAIVTCFEEAKDQRAYSKCATDLFTLEKQKLAARKAAAGAGAVPEKPVDTRPENAPPASSGPAAPVAPAGDAAPVAPPAPATDAPAPAAPNAPAGTPTP